MKDAFAVYKSHHLQLSNSISETQRRPNLSKAAVGHLEGTAHTSSLGSATNYFLHCKLLLL